MDTNVLVALITTGGAIVTAIITFLGVILGRRNNRNDDKKEKSSSKKSLKNIVNNLPSLSSIGKLLGKGRNNKLKEIVDSLANHRLIVLSAIGGTGKTTLARNIAEHYLNLKEKPFDAIIWISAKPPQIINFNEVIDEIARTLGYREKISQIDNVEDKKAEIRKILNEINTLFIFDNYETVADSNIDNFIGATIPDNNRIIVTTRHIERPLSKDQFVYEIERLDPDDGKDVIKKEFENKELVYTDELAERIYTLTGGLPQAIVWAVAQLKHHIAIEAIEGAVARGEAKISGGEELFENLFALSWNILNETHKRILKALLFFVTPVAKKALKAATDLSVPDFDQGITLLSGLSLISTNTAIEEDNIFFSMHSWTRIFVERKTNYKQAQDETIVAQKLSKYYIDFCANRVGKNRSIKGYSELEYEFPNIKKVLSILNSFDELDVNNYIQIINLAKVINVFLWSRGLWKERIDVCKSAYFRAEALAERCKNQTQQALLYADAGQQAYYVGIVLFWQGKIDEAHKWAQKSDECMQLSNNEIDIALSRRLYALIKTKQGHYEDALTDFAEVLRVVELNEGINQEKTAMFADWDITGSEYYKVGRLAILQETGICYNTQAQSLSGMEQIKIYNKAMGVLLKSKALAEEINDNEGLSVSLSHLGHTYFGLQQYSSAKKCYQQAYALSSAIQRKSTMARACEGLAKVGAIKHQNHTLIRYGKLAMDLFDRLGMATEYESLEKIFIDKKITYKEKVK